MPVEEQRAIRDRIAVLRSDLKFLEKRLRSGRMYSTDPLNLVQQAWMIAWHYTLLARGQKGER